LKRTTVFVQPSAHENFGASIAEALLFGKACIVSDGVGLSEDIALEKAGLVFARLLSDNFRSKVVAANLKKQYNLCISELQ
jgi:glycosyltransferase involved in cell wall biosynthesis